MRYTKLLTAVLIAGSLGACANSPPPATADASSTAPNASSQMPQSPNSLPAGDTVNAPVAGTTGTVGATQVSPSASTGRTYARGHAVHRRHRNTHRAATHRRAVQPARSSGAAADPTNPAANTGTPAGGAPVIPPPSTNAPTTR